MTDKNHRSMNDTLKQVSRHSVKEILCGRRERRYSLQQGGTIEQDHSMEEEAGQAEIEAAADQPGHLHVSQRRDTSLCYSGTEMPGTVTNTLTVRHTINSSVTSNI